VPRINGIEFLKELRPDGGLKKSVVFVWSTSDADEDQGRAYEFGVAGYIVKWNPADALREATALLDT
jgi:DNA-binding NarL/FixJ family response regulator